MWFSPTNTEVPGIEWMNPRPVLGMWTNGELRRLKSCWKLRNFAQHCGNFVEKKTFSFKTFEKQKVIGRSSNCPSHPQSIWKGNCEDLLKEWPLLHPQRREVEPSRPFLFHPMNRRGRISLGTWYDVVTGPKAPSWLMRQDGRKPVQLYSGASWLMFFEVVDSPGHFLLGVCDVIWETDKIHMIPYIICMKKLNVDQ